MTAPDIYSTGTADDIATDARRRAAEALGEPLTASLINGLQDLIVDLMRAVRVATEAHGMSRTAHDRTRKMLADFIAERDSLQRELEYAKSEIVRLDVERGKLRHNVDELEASLSKVIGDALAHSRDLGKNHDLLREKLDAMTASATCECGIPESVGPCLRCQARALLREIRPVLQVEMKLDAKEPTNG